MNLQAVIVSNTKVNFDKFKFSIQILGFEKDETLKSSINIT